MDNSFGTIFRITSFGESHGKLVGIILDGVPAGLNIDLNFIQSELNKRRPAQSQFTTSRSEEDKVNILSGIFKNKTTGAPVCLVIENKEIDSSYYEKYKNYLRPSHADYTVQMKYGGFSDYRGSGRSSGRITAGFVMAGAVAKQILKKYGIFVFAYTKSVGSMRDDQNYLINEDKNLIRQREKSSIRALNVEKAKLMEELVREVKNQKDSIGGTVKCIVTNFPEGKGGPVFNNIQSNISKAIFAIPAIKGIEFGAGFRSSMMKGSEHNDPWILKDDKIITSKNDSGGIIGGISTGMPIEFTVAVKPTASIGIPQKTVDLKNKENVEIEFSGRHDPCIVPRIIPVIEAMTANVLLDYLLVDGYIPSILKSM
jgi:chorismate synthase